MIFSRERGVHGVEFFDVVGAVVGGESDAGEDDGGAAGLELVDDAVEVGLGLFEGEAAEAVVAAELYDDELGMAGDDAGDAVEAVLGGVAADAGVEDVVVVAAGVEELLEDVGIGLAGLGAVAGGERVAEADEERAGVGGRDGNGGWLRLRLRCGCCDYGGFGGAACFLAAEKGGGEREAHQSYEASSKTNTG